MGVSKFNSRLSRRNYEHCTECSIKFRVGQFPKCALCFSKDYPSREIGFKEWRKRWKKVNKDHSNKLRRKKYMVNPQHHRDLHKKSYLALKEKMFAIYGKECRHCGETIKEFLTLDHINNNGYSHRKEKGSIDIWRESVKNPDLMRYQILCLNCNFIKFRSKPCYDTWQSQYFRKIREEIYDRYGNKCDCCGITEYKCLSIDHLNPEESKEDRKLGTLSRYLKIKRENFPKDKYRLLCMNCNYSLGMRKYCPHQLLIRAN